MKNTFFLILVILTFLISCQKEKATVSEEDRLKLANAYYTNGLYEAAAQEYLDYLASSPLDAARQANTYYQIANIYFERLNDYDKALVYFFKIKYLYPESNLQSEVGKRIVSCLERSQRSADAARIFEKEAALDQSKIQESKPGEVLAEIGSRKITQGDVDFEISRLPQYISQQIHEKNKKREFLQQLIMQELLFDSAKRQGLDKDKDVLEATYRAQKSLMAERLLQQELQGQVKIEPADVELYYLAHKDQYAEKDDKGNVKRQKSFQEAQQQAAQDLAMDRQQQAYQKLLQRLMQAQNVKVYEERLQ